MIGLLVDHNIERHGQLLWAQFSAADWRAMQVSSLATLLDAGLSHHASDLELWLFCQRRWMLLLTANRNQRGEDSLQAVLDELKDSQSVPVLTLANSNRVLVDPIYRELCAYRIADIALDLRCYLGTARVFIP
jgi:hypothetical protein